ncbi:MT-A70-domain-containing protein, partial [Zopfochytrium polystomum]
MSSKWWFGQSGCVWLPPDPTNGVSVGVDDDNDFGGGWFAEGASNFALAAPYATKHESEDDVTAYSEEEADGPDHIVISQSIANSSRKRKRPKKQTNKEESEDPLLEAIGVDENSILLAHKELCLDSGLFPLQSYCQYTPPAPFDPVNWVAHIAESSDARPKVIRDLVDKVNENNTDDPQHVDIDEVVTVIIPRRSAFLLSDMSMAGPLKEFGAFDLIVMDPPWPNTSVSRYKNYKPTTDIYSLFTLPVPSLLSQTAVVAVWITNRPRVARFVRNKLFPAWGLEPVATWVWLKVTRNGEPVLPISGSRHRRSYEPILIGQRVGRDKRVPAALQLEREKMVVIASVPSREHSRKPPIGNVLRSFSVGSKKLELFARCVRPGWVCWGNEVLKFNDTRYLESANTGFHTADSAT